MDNRGDVIATTASVSKVEKFRRLYISAFSYAVPVHASLSIILSVLACTLFPSLYLASIRCIIIFFLCNIFIYLLGLAQRADGRSDRYTIIIHPGK